MDSAFYKLKPALRDTLINAGTKEFATHGRERSSLNKMLKEAGVSKGVFYHHFEDKEQFFVELIKYSGEVIITYLNKNNLLDETDFIERMIQSMLLKYDLFMKYEFFLDFLIKLFKEYKPEEVGKWINTSDHSFTQRVLTENLDKSLFNDSMTFEEHQKVIGRYINQLSTEVSHNFKHMSKEQVESYYRTETKTLQKLCYKEGKHD